MISEAARGNVLLAKFPMSSVDDRQGGNKCSTGHNTDFATRELKGPRRTPAERGAEKTLRVG